MPNQIVRGISVATRCRTVSEFIERYAERTDTDSIFVRAEVDTTYNRTLDRECGFAFLLANKQPVLAGTCMARELRAANNPFRRDGLELTFVRLGPSSRLVFEALHERRAQLHDVKTVPTPLLQDATPSPAPVAHRGPRMVALAAITLVLVLMFLQARPKTAAAHASARTWLGMPVSAPLASKPVEHTALNPKECK